MPIEKPKVSRFAVLLAVSAQTEKTGGPIRPVLTRLPHGKFKYVLPAAEILEGQSPRSTLVDQVYKKIDITDIEIEYEHRLIVPGRTEDVVYHIFVGAISDWGFQLNQSQAWISALDNKPIGKMSRKLIQEARRQHWI